MKKLLIPALTVFVLQVVIGWISLKTIVGDPTPAGIGLGGFSGQTQLWPLGLVAFMAVPIIGGKLISDSLSRPISWKKALALYFSVLAVVILIAILWSVIHTSTSN